MKLLLATISVFCTFLVYSQFDYDTINDARSIPAINSCGNVDACFSLTPDENYKSGAVWDTKKINLNNNFDATFCLTFGNRNGWGADGISFIMRGDNQDTMGNLGAWLGAGAISPSVIIEFDTYENTDIPGITDLAVDHTALYFNGDFTNAILGPTTLLTNSGNVDVGNSHSVRVVWNAGTQRLRMFFDGVQRINYQGDIVNNVFTGNNLITWGFTASTGGVSNLQQVCFPKYQISLADTKTICEGDSVLLSYYNPNITSYRWRYEIDTIKNWNSLDFSIPFNLDDSSFYATQAGKYYFEVELNNQALKDSIELIVVPLPQKAFANDVDLLCLAETNYVLTAPQTTGDTYLWSTGAISQQINVATEGEYSVTITEPINSCQTTDNIKIINFCKDESICEGDSATISFYTENITSYKWTFEDGTVFKNWNSGFPTLFDLNDTVFYPSQMGRYYLDIAIGTQVFRDSLDLTVVPLPSKPFVEEIILNCFEGNNTYSLNAQNTGNSYLWSTNETSQQITVNTFGKYDVEITEPQLSCKNFDTLKIVSFCKDTSICAGDFATISFYEDNITSYKWTYKEDGTVHKDWNTGFPTPFDLNDTVFYPSQAGTYYLDLKIKSQIIKDSMELAVVPLPLKPFVETEITSCLDQKEYVLDALNSGNTYLWSTNDTTQQISVSEAGLYFVEITEPILSCKNYDTLTVISFCKTDLICPNIFTPNGDLLNDYYEVTFTNDFTWIKDFQFRVFNRWNELVYSVENQTVKWDGTFNEKELTNGVYFYIFTYKDAFSDEEFKGNGNIQLVR
ncbi:MAG: gliding motility-associated C-terminal domain-containing protein [Bacteroidota bacterium]